MPFIEQAKPAAGDPTRKEDIDTLIDNSTFLNNNIAASVGGLIINWSFETDADSDGEADGWVYTNYTGGSNALETSNESGGVTSQSFTSTVLANGGCYADSLDYFEVIGDEYYNWQIKVHASVANVSSRYQVTWYDDTKTSISTSTLFSDANTPTARFKKFSSVQAPTTARYAKVRIEGGVPATGSATGVIYFDNVYFGLVTGHVVELGRDEFTAATSLIEYSWPATTFDVIILDFSFKVNSAGAVSIKMSENAGTSYLSSNYVDTQGNTGSIIALTGALYATVETHTSGRIIIANVSDTQNWKMVTANIAGVNSSNNLALYSAGGYNTSKNEITGISIESGTGMHPGQVLCRGIRRND